jgi:hypothetical protein
MPSCNCIGRGGRAHDVSLSAAVLAKRLHCDKTRVDVHCIL